MATIHIDRPGIVKVTLVDHDRRRQRKTLTINNGTFTIDGNRDRTLYYLIE